MKHVPDAIICDVMMPVMDDWNVAEAEMELQTSHIPVMLLTACSLDEQRIQGLNVERILYISKPLIPNCYWCVFWNLIDNHKRLKTVFREIRLLCLKSL